MPRLTAWYGDEGTRYTYSGIENVPLPWTPAILEVKRAVERPAGVVFNSVLLNRYRSGRDSVSWHADDAFDKDLMRIHWIVEDHNVSRNQVGPGKDSGNDVITNQEGVFHSA